MIKNRWWLANQPTEELKGLALFLWQRLHNLADKLDDAVHPGQMVQAVVDRHWEDLSEKPEINAQERWAFLKQLEQYQQIYGTLPGIALLKDTFGLDDLVVEELRFNPQGEEFPRQAIRIWISRVSPEIKTRVHNYLRLLLPARCLFHYQLLDKDNQGGFGTSQFGRSFGS